MKLTVNQSPDFTDTEITINCRQVTAELQTIIDRLRLMDCSVKGRLDGEIHVIPADRICYFDSVDSRSFAYCDDSCYEVDESLNELESRLRNLSFVRISKNTIVCLRALKSVKGIDFSRMRLTLRNGEQLIVSRHYLRSFKEAFGL